MSTIRISFLGILALALAMFGPAAPTALADGNADAAHACQKGGWQDLAGEGGVEFRNAGECMNFAAQGGTLVPASLYGQWAALCSSVGGAVSADLGSRWVCTGNLGTTIAPLSVICDGAGGIPGLVLEDGVVTEIYCAFY